MKKSTGTVGMTVGRSILMGALSLTFVFFTIVFIFLNFYTPTIALPSDEDIMLDIPPVILEADEEGNMPITASEGENSESEEAVTALSGNKGNTFYNILLCGRDFMGGTTDTIIIASFDVKNQQLSVLSVPRDTYLLATPSPSSRKINSVFQAGYNAAKNSGKGKNDCVLEGMKTLRAVIKQVFGVPIHCGVYVDLAGFNELVDLVGGVEVNVPFKMDYEDPEQNLFIHLKPGLQTLYGKDAEGFARFRSAAGYDDYGRMGAQQQVITALIKKCMSQPAKISQFISTGYKYVVTDLSNSNILYFAKEMLKLKPENIRFNTVPSEGRNIGAGSYVTLYKEETMQIINKYHNWYTEDLTEDKFNIAVYPRLSSQAVNIDGTTMDQMSN